MTEYTLAGEASLAVALTGAELMGVTQAGVYKFSKLSDWLSYVASAPTIGSSITFTGTQTYLNGNVYAGQVNIVASGQSVLLGTTTTMKVGFYGAAGTSQRTAGTQVTMTLSSFTGVTQGNVGFTSTAQASLLFGQVQEIQQTLLDLGVWKGS